MATDIDTLVSMGFSRGKVQKAWKATKGAGLQPAMDWILEHPEVSDEPDVEESSTGQSLNTTTSTTDASTDTPTENEEGEIFNGEQTAHSLICNDCQKLFRDSTAAERHAIRTQHQNFSESTEVIAPLSEEEKKQKLAELKARLAEKRALKAQEEEAERKQAEKIRRKAGQDLSEVKQQLEAKEIKKAFDLKRKEKEDDKKALAKIKAQIEADKRDRAAKKEAAKNGTPIPAVAAPEVATPVAASAPAAKKEYTEARLQIRVPGISPLTSNFPADATLSSVQTYLQSNGCVNNFTLSTTFPRKTFGTDDLNKSLKELGLVPSSALVLTYI
ncbi:C2H2-type zinc finger transcription factor [Phycomyces blakesleeanus NRRL 1555(-)]|uniref:C2H2-type zinc finger transcription factor n=1 Tax=Phycomyces blakesleeanus (strain ATCC 8743b / DSM 1359 / FGSC 10004 / NBRC 33097 / NRRL 1555) TaxID=763407 RepID=A0A162XWB5_PHYB8|nr:C2H2-type zinc finger transcription factor [Phycomyces blakesleeanus NRRL 1555(-)]OAD76805.1 C2H2-type zinc finger transcription factor [Phycomyces blakesleeanus NRRL 1555(-)]|eukprot:XP_018294845.1 C2H2-type zinc finger transcription factor [Phycomyces blakesleeanus NRRL 1555(-)]